jgi:hypothetical protein
MNRITESAIEEFLIELLENKSFQFIHDPHTAKLIKANYRGILDTSNTGWPQ